MRCVVLVAVAPGACGPGPGGERQACTRSGRAVEPGRVLINRDCSGDRCLMSGLTPKRPGQRTLVDVSKVPVGGHQCTAVRRTKRYGTFGCINPPWPLRT